MKIKLSKYWWINLYAMIGNVIIMEIFLGYFFINSSGEDFAWGVGLMIAWALVIGSIILMSRKYLMTMKIDNNIIRSFLFGKLKCEVDTNKIVYYTVFKCLETNTIEKTYIAISNEVFCYEERKPTIWSRNLYIDYYDRTKQIVFPYDEKTKYLFPIENWIKVNEKYSESSGKCV